MPAQPSPWPTDPVFGNVLQALSPQHLMRHLQDNTWLRADVAERRWSQCRVIEALYDPGKHLRIAYALGDEGVGRGRLWPDGDVFYLRYPVRQPMSRRGSVTHIGGFDVEVYRFPNDRRLRGLRGFAGRQAAAEVWQSWLREDEPGLVLQPDSLRRELLRYVPEQKWIVRLHAQCRDAGTSGSVKRALAIRCCDTVDCEIVYRRTLALRRCRELLEGAFRIPKPVAYDDQRGLLACRWVWGDSLLELLRSHQADTIMGRVAGGLHALHRMPLTELDTKRPADYLASARLCVQDLSLALPALKAPLESLLSALEQRCPANHNHRHATVHNDFHWNQIRGRADRLTLLDFERCVISDPYVDVATFTTQLSMLAARQDVDVSPAEAETWKRAFLDAWESTSASLIDLNRLQWYGTTALLTLARGMLRHLRPGWDELAQKCTELAAAELSPSSAEVIL